MDVLKKNWPLLIAVLGAVFWGRQCGQTGAARAAYDTFRDSANVRERALSNNLAVSTDTAEALLKNLVTLVSDNDQLRDQRDAARAVAAENERRARKAQPVAHEDTDGALNEIVQQYPETKPLVLVARRSLFRERELAGQLTDAISISRDRWEADANTSRSELEEALDVVIPALRMQISSAMALSEDRLRRAIRAESEYEREKRSGIFDIGVPDWLGTGVAFIGGAATVYLVGKAGG